MSDVPPFPWARHSGEPEGRQVVASNSYSAHCPDVRAGVYVAARAGRIEGATITEARTNAKRRVEKDHFDDCIVAGPEATPLFREF